MAATDKQIYVRLVNPSDEEVNDMILSGYSIHSITPIRDEIIKQGNLINVRDSLVYHFTLRKKKEVTE